MPRSKHAPVSSFSPRLFEVWRAALTRKITIPVESKAEGTRLRFRLYELRSAMKNEKHPDHSSAARVSLFVQQDSKGQWAVIAMHADSGFDRNLDAAGIVKPEQTAPALDEILALSPDDRKPIKED